LVKKAPQCAPHYAPDAQGVTVLIVSSLALGLVPHTFWAAFRQ